MNNETNNQKRKNRAARTIQSHWRESEYRRENRNIARLNNSVQAIMTANAARRRAGRPSDRLIRTLRSFLNAKRRLDEGALITRFGNIVLSNYEILNNNEQNSKRAVFMEELVKIVRHLQAPNSNYTNNKPPRGMDIETWRAIPMHNRRWVKFTRGQWAGSHSHMTIGGHNVNY